MGIRRATYSAGTLTARSRSRRAMRIQAGIVSGKRVSHWLQSINQSSKLGIHGTLIPNAFQQCRLSTAGHSASLRHIGGLVPAVHRLCCVKIVNLG